MTVSTDDIGYLLESEFPDCTVWQYYLQHPGIRYPFHGTCEIRFVRSPARIAGHYRICRKIGRPSRNIQEHDLFALPVKLPFVQLFQLLVRYSVHHQDGFREHLHEFSEQCPEFIVRAGQK